MPVVEGVRRGTNGVATARRLRLGCARLPAGADRHRPGASRTGHWRPLRHDHASPVPPAAYSHVRVSRDGTRAAIGIDDGKHASVLIYPLNGASTIQRLPLEGNSRFPVWSPDGRWIAFQSDRGGDLGIFRQRADGTGVAERLTTAAAGEEHVPESWSPDGRHLSFACRKVSAAGTRIALWMLTLADQTTAAFGGVSSVEPIGSVFSPDGKWLAYAKGTWRRRIGCQPRRLRAAVPGNRRGVPGAEAAGGLPSGVGGIGRRNSCSRRAATAGQMVAVPVSPPRVA